MPHAVTLPDGFEVSDDPSRLDLPRIHAFLSTESYWAQGRSLETVARSIAHSLNFGIYAPSSEQVAFGRLVTDFTTAAHLTDVCVFAAWRGRGFGKALVAAIVGHPELATVRRWTLSTQDAHGLYVGFGFGAVLHPEREMMRAPPKQA